MMSSFYIPFGNTCGETKPRIQAPGLPEGFIMSRTDKHPSYVSVAFLNGLECPYATVANHEETFAHPAWDLPASSSKGQEEIKESFNMSRFSEGADHAGK
jgi:hypothetical protein